MALTLTPYQRAVAAVEAVAWRGIKPGLERTTALLEQLGSPHTGLRGVLVAGTNGKGSVCALVDSVLRAAGLRTVLLTKPHLFSYRERIACDGDPIGEEDFARVIDDVVAAAAVLPEALQPTGFELLTVAGILVAARRGAHAVVCEVGMGGRLDSTNVLDLGVAVVTNVALDHREHLGDTVVDIAREKAAIVKSGDVAVTAAQPPALQVIAGRCDAVGARLVSVAVAGASHGLAGVSVSTRFAGADLTVRSALVGGFQLANVATAVTACDELRAAGLPIDAAAVAEGCSSARWPGRMHWFAGEPPVLVDAAHNPAGVEAMAAAVRDVAAGRRLVVLFAAMRDKDVSGMVTALGALRAAAHVVTSPRVQRAWPAAELASQVSPSAVIAATAAEGLDAARDLAGPDGLVVVCGSLFLAAEVLRRLGGAAA